MSDISIHGVGNIFVAKMNEYKEIIDILKKRKKK